MILGIWWVFHFFISVALSESWESVMAECCLVGYVSSGQRGLEESLRGASGKNQGERPRSWVRGVVGREILQVYCSEANNCL